jgi:uncharacterized RDD family membrane protein YckC
MASWFYTDALAAQQGPVDDETLLELNASGVVKARSLVWREGLPAWTAFREVAGPLFSARPKDGNAAAATLKENESEPVAIGVCAFSGRVYPMQELLPYGEALVGPEHIDAFVRRLMEGAAVEIADATHRTLDYAGFWWRCLSSLLDYLITMIPSGLCMVPYYAAAIFAGATRSTDPDSLEGITGMTALMAAAYGVGLLGVLALSIAYETWMVGRYQATLGKIILGLKVVNPDGSRLTYKRAFVRWLAKKPLNTLIVWIPSTVGFALVIAAISAMADSGGDDGATVVLAMVTGLFVYAALVALCSGVYWMAAFDPEKRTLHDRVGSTRVVRK